MIHPSEIVSLLEKRDKMVSLLPEAKRRELFLAEEKEKAEYPLHYRRQMHIGHFFASKQRRDIEREHSQILSSLGEKTALYLEKKGDLLVLAQAIYPDDPEMQARYLAEIKSVSSCFSL